MSKLTQKETIHESRFRNGLRGLASATITAAKTLAPEITTPLGQVVQPFKAMKQAFSNQQPLYILKEFLSKKTDIEFIKLVNQETRTANPDKPWYKKITGPKNVTLITFTATVYHKGKVRDYKPYTEATNRGLPRPNDIIQFKPKTQSTGMVPFQPKTQLGNPSMRQASGRVIPPSTPAPNQGGATPAPGTTPAPNQDTLTAEIFRTSEGLQVGQIFSTKTGRVYYSEKEQTLPVFNNEIINFKDSSGQYTIRTVSAFLQRIVKISDATAKSIKTGATNIPSLIQLTTGVSSTAPDTIIPPGDIDKLRDVLVPLYVESKNVNRGISQRELIKETTRLI